MTISLDGVTKEYGGRRVVDGVGFEVPSGRITGFVGANGAGKTTVMRMMMGLLAPCGGSILVDGEPMSREYRAGIGYMPDQQALHPEASAMGQLMFFAEVVGIRRAEARGAVSALLGQLGLADRAGEPVSGLSLGNRRKVQLASVLLRRPTALVMDEPFSGLDPEAVDYMEPVLREYAELGVPVLFSSHQLDLVERLCDRLVVIGRGRVKAEGSIADLTQGHPEELVVRYAGASLPDDASLPESVTVVSHDPDAKKLVVAVDPKRQAHAVRQLTHAMEVLEASEQRVPLAESYRGIIDQEGNE